PRARKWERAANWWVAPLYPALYPAPGRRRQPNDSGRFGWFGEDSVVERPSSRRAAEDNVRPGVHGFDSRSSEAEDGSGAYEVVWWNPNQLKRTAPRRYGVRRSDLLSPVQEGVIEADVKSYNVWVTQRAELIGRGSQPSLIARTATEVAATKEGEPGATESQSAHPVEVLEIAPDLDRPGGPRYGALVHAVLATVALDADRKQIGESAALQGRILGATEAEMASAAEVVGRVLASDLLARARASHENGLCRRETPVTVR